MFQLDFVEKEGKLVCLKVNPPVIGSEAVDRYAQRVLGQAQVLSSALLGLLQDEKVVIE